MHPSRSTTASRPLPPRPGLPDMKPSATPAPGRHTRARGQGAARAALAPVLASLAILGLAVLFARTLLQLLLAIVFPR